MQQPQVALVSGAGSESGIGFAICRILGQQGVRILLTASSERIEQRAAELRAEGIEARGRAADLTDESQVQALFQWAEAQWGHVDILVNNAGMAMQGSPEPFADLATMDLATWNLSIARNLSTAFLLTRAGLRAHRQYQLHHRHPWQQHWRVCLQCGQGRDARHEHGRGAGGGQARHHREQRCAGLDCHRLIHRRRDSGG